MKKPVFISIFLFLIAQMAFAADNGVQPSADSDLFVRVIPSKTRLYEQDFLLLTYKIYTVLDVTNVQPHGSFPACRGFFKQDIDQPQKAWLLDEWNARTYKSVLVWQTLLFPQETGNIEIESADFEAVVRRKNGNRTLREKRILTAPALTITVDRLPEPRPTGFSGAVGTFSLQRSLSADKTIEGEAFTLKYIITGSGNMKLIRNPKLRLPPKFEAYDPKVSSDLQNTVAGVSGTKTIEYSVVPHQAGDFALPADTFRYFDVEAKVYRNIILPALAVRVDKGNGSFNADSQLPSALADEDISPLTADKMQIRDKNRYFFGSLAFWLCCLALLLVLGAALLLYRYRIKTGAAVRSRKASRNAAGHLQAAASHIAKGEKEAFYREISRALSGYLSDKQLVELSVFSKEKAQNALADRGVEPELINELNDIITLCEYARYAHSEDTGEMDGVYQRAQSVLERLEGSFDKKRGQGAVSVHRQNRKNNPETKL